MIYTILIADDDPDIREVVKILLESDGYRVLEAANGAEAIEKAGEADLCILDIMMPGMNGYQACREIRKVSTAPILFLTAKSQDGDKAVGFASGADDYLVKPFSYTELSARVKALLRRYYVYRGKAADEESGIIKIKELEIDKAAQEVKRGGELISLTDIEYGILVLLAENRRKVFSAQEIYEAIWKEAYFYACNNTIMVHIRNLRRKIETDSENPQIIKTVWGKGYRID